MRVDLYGLSFETPQLTVHLWSPWRCSALEHRMFEAVRELPRIPLEQGPDEWRLLLTDPKVWRATTQALARVLKGWQEEGDPARERRSWRWLVEGDTDDHGYDHTGEPSALWLLVRVSLERGGVGEAEKAEDIDLEGFGIQVAGHDLQ